MANLMENLNQEQLEAVLHREGPLLIVAGAGTGKTTVISQKIAYMIEQGWAGTEEILALTFTEKAAEEMESRVGELLPIGYFDLWVSTFHGFCERILKAHGLDIGLPGDFRLLNEFEQWVLVKKNLDRFKLDYYRPMGNPTKFIRALLRHFSRLKDEDIGPEEYLKYAEELKADQDAMLGGAKKVKSKRSKVKEATHPQLNEDGEMGTQEIARINEVAEAYHTYQQLLLENNSLDFGDIIGYTLRLFKKRPAILKKYREQFKYVLVDEFQDTNWAQYELVKMLAAGRDNLVVVGDDDQSIYKFRGASVANILQFKKDFPKAKQIVLVRNYRSRQNILDLAYGFIKLNDPNRLEWQLAQENQKRKKQETRFESLDKKLIAKDQTKGIIEVIEGEDLEDEVRRVVEKIGELKSGDKKASWSDFAILVRANDAAKEFCSYLDLAGLPYQFLASRGLYAKPVIMDLISYLKLLDDYHESRALYRVLNLPFFKFAYEELVNFNYWAGRKSWSLFEVLKNASLFNFQEVTREKIGRVLDLITKHESSVRHKSVSEVIFAFLNDSGYLKYLNGLEEAKEQEILNYLNQFMKRAKAFEAGSDDKSVKQFLRELEMEMDSGEEGSLAPDLESGPEAIKVMTAHGSKGTEYKHVFIANLVDKRFPTIERKEQIEIPNALVREALPEGDVHLEEERRLFYVAMTRAKEGLYFSWASDYGGARKKKPSRFLEECGLVSEGKKALKKGENMQLFSRPVAVVPAKMNFQPPSYFSYTQLAAFSNCPHQYRFAHVLKVPIRGKSVFSFGKTLHSTLQKLFQLINEKNSLKQADLFGGEKDQKGTKVSFAELEKFYQESWIDDWYGSKDEKEKSFQKGKEILKGFYEKYKDDWPAALFLEKSFNIKIRSGQEIYTVRGAIDRIDDVGSKLKIVDYKTGRPKEKLTFEEKEQLLIYQMAVQELFRQEVASLAFYYLDDNSEIEFVGTEEELGKVRDKIVDIISRIRRGEFPAKPSQLCKYCDFYDICEARQN